MFKKDEMPFIWALCFKAYLFVLVPVSLKPLSFWLVNSHSPEQAPPTMFRKNVLPVVSRVEGWIFLHLLKRSQWFSVPHMGKKQLMDKNDLPNNNKRFTFTFKITFIVIHNFVSDRLKMLKTR